MSDEIERSFQAGIAGSLRGSFLPLGDMVEESEDFIRGYRADLSVAVLVVKMGEQEASFWFFRSGGRHPVDVEHNE